MTFNAKVAKEQVMTCPNCGQRVKMHLTFGGYRCPLCGYNSGGAHEKESRRMAPEPADVTRLLREAATTDNPEHRDQLVAEAERRRAEITAGLRHANDVDLTNTVVAERLTPVRVHEHHTAATDWLGDITVEAKPDIERAMLAEGSVWYASRSEQVKAHPDELAQQALGKANQLAGRYGEQADLAEKTFLDHVGALHAKDVNAGLIAVAAAETREPYSITGDPTGQGLPGEMTTSERAPAIQDVQGNGSGGSTESNGWPDPPVLPGQNVDAGNGDSGTRMVASKVEAGASGPGKYKLIADDHDPDASGPRGNEDGGWHHKAGDVVHVLGVDTFGDEDGTVWAQVKHPAYPREVSHISPANLRPIRGRNASMANTTAQCPACGGHGRVAVRVQGASGLDQIDQTVDPHDNPKATPYPEDIAFPWEMPNDSSEAINEAEQQLAQREKMKGASRQQRAVAAAKRAAEQAYLRAMAGQDDSGFLGDNGAGGNRPGYQDGGNPGNTYPGNIADADPVYGYGGDNGNQPLKPYGADEADDYTNNPGQNWQPGQPTQADVAGRGNMVGQPTTANLQAEIDKALRFVRQARQLQQQGR